MNRLRIRAYCGINDFFDRQITLRRRGWADFEGLIGHSDVEGAAVRFRVDGDSRYAHLSACAYDAHRNFAPIGNEDLFEHRHSMVAGAASPNGMQTMNNRRSRTSESPKLYSNRPATRKPVNADNAERAIQRVP